LVLLLEGARVSRQAVSTQGPWSQFLASADAVIASFQRSEKAGQKRHAKSAKARAAVNA